VITVNRLQSYLRHVARQERDAVTTPPFTIFFHPSDSQVYFNYAIPDQPIEGDLETALARLRTTFAARGRRPRFEFIEEYAPALTRALRAHGFSEEARMHLMVCTPATYRAAPEVTGLTVVIQDADTPLDEISVGLDTNGRGFDPAAAPATEAEAVAFRQGLVTSRAFLARLAGRPAGAGMFTPPLDGLTELVGITTLEEFRRRGVAAALTACAVRTAFDQGVEAAFLSAADERAGRVYERVGFQPFATMVVYIDQA
jgi:ribosomal protein S18 acetylase RimI-like enzyme